VRAAASFLALEQRLGHAFDGNMGVSQTQGVPMLLAIQLLSSLLILELVFLICWDCVSSLPPTSLITGSFAS